MDSIARGNMQIIKKRAAAAKMDLRKA